MSNVKPVNAHDTLLKIGNGATPEVFQTVAKVTSDFDGPGITRASHKATGREDTYAEKLAGVPDAGQLSFTIAMLFGNASHQLLLTKADTGDETNFEIHFPTTTGTVWGLRGFLASFKLGPAEDGVLTAAVTIELNGKPTWS